MKTFKYFWLFGLFLPLSSQALSDDSHNNTLQIQETHVTLEEARKQREQHLKSKGIITPYRRPSLRRNQIRSGQSYRGNRYRIPNRIRPARERRFNRSTSDNGQQSLQSKREKRTERFSSDDHRQRKYVRNQFRSQYFRQFYNRRAQISTQDQEQ
jgi:hypothetical protein